MKIDEQWVGKIAGWKALKAGRDLLRSGGVMEASISEDEKVIEGVVRGSGKPIPITLTINGPFDIDNTCRCFAAKRRGEICEHAVAVMLYALDVPLAQEVKARKAKQVEASSAASAGPQIELRPLKLVLPPQFPDDLERGCTVKVETLDGEAGPADIKLLLWMSQLGLRDVPPMMALRPQDLSGFLKALIGHPRCEKQSGESLQIVGDGVRLPMTLEKEDDRVALALLQNEVVSYQWVKGSVAAWDSEQQVLALVDVSRMSGGLGETQWMRMVGGGRFALPVKSFLRNTESWGSMLDWGSAQWMQDLRVKPAPVRFKLTLEGSTSALKAKLDAVYPGRVEIPVGGSVPDSPFPIQDRNAVDLWMVRNEDSENRAAAVLLDAGMIPADAAGGWTIQGDDAVLDFLSTVLPELQDAPEWTVESGARIRSISSNVVRVQPDIKFEGSGEDWLAFDYGFKTDSGQAIPRETIQKMLAAGRRTATTKNGKKVVISSFDAEVMTEVLRDVDPRQEGGKFFVKPQQAAYLRRVKSYYGSGMEFEPDDSILKQLPEEVRGLYRPYQEEGIVWLHERVKSEKGALLADDMGLGKTLQTLSLIHLLKNDAEGPALVVCPTTLLINWRDEAEKFFPDLKVLVMHGPKRKEYFGKLDGYDVVITSYSLVARDLDLYVQEGLGAIVLDEASVIRNPDTQAAKALRKLNVEYRLALTGTPIENALQDLWSIYAFLLPGYLGEREEFKNRYVNSCMGDSPDQHALKRLRMRVEPFMLRRTKEKVAQDLPAKLEQTIWCEPSELQKQSYEAMLRDGAQRVQDAAKQSKGQAKMQMLTTLLRLRQICCDLRLLGDEGEEHDLGDVSSKVVRLIELLQEAKAGGHRVLIFSQFTKMLGLLKAVLSDRGMDYCYLDGATQNRGDVVKKFQKDNGPFAFLISLKAGGYGLNLTAADTVIHFDPWWNPAVEAQATDRAHRIGQTRPTNVYKLITRGTVEEKILRLQDKKRGLIGSAIGDEASMGGLSGDEISSLLE